MLIRDPEFAVGNRPGRIRIRAFGNYNFRITDPGLFFKEIVGTNGCVTTDDIERYLKSRLVSSFTQAASKSELSVMDMAGHYDVLANAVRNDISDDFGAIGIELTSMIIENISLPAEIEQAIDAAAAQSARGVDNTMSWEAMQGMRDVARNAHKGGGTGGVMGAGMGMGMGMGGAHDGDERRGRLSPAGISARHLRRATRRDTARLPPRSSPRPPRPPPPRAPSKTSSQSSRPPSTPGSSPRRSTTRRRASCSRRSELVVIALPHVRSSATVGVLRS